MLPVCLGRVEARPRFGVIVRWVLHSSVFLAGTVRCIFCSHVQERGQHVFYRECDCGHRPVEVGNIPSGGRMTRNVYLDAILGRDTVMQLCGVVA